MLLTIQDACKLLSLSERALMKHVKSGDLAASHVDNYYSFNRTELVEWALKSGLKLSQDLVKKKASQFSQHWFSPAKALKQGGIHRNVQGAGHDDLLRSIITLLPLPDKIDRQSVFELLKAREAMGLTAIGSGMAIPNVRSPIIARGYEVAVALFMLKNPLTIATHDDTPVTFVFEIVSPSARMHLEVLALLSQIFDLKGFIEILQEGASDEEIFSYLDLMEKS